MAFFCQLFTQGEKDMLYLILGGLTVAAFFLLFNYTQKKGVRPNWWQWLLTVLGFLLALFTLAAVGTLIGEGTGQAALVTGVIFGIVTVVWGVLLGRFVFKKA